MKIVRKIFDVLQNDHDRNITGLETSVTDSSLCILVSLLLRKDHPHYTTTFTMPIAGADPGFQLMGVHLKKLRRAEGGAKIFGVFCVKNHDFMPKNHIFSNCRGRRENCSCEKSRFYAKRSYFFQLRREARKLLGISCEKLRFYAKKSYIFQLRREARKLFV